MPTDTASRPAKSPRGPRQAGFSLMELVIASALALIVSAMMFSVLTAQDQSAARADANTQMQDQLRFALRTMATQIRMTGYGIGAMLLGPLSWDKSPVLRTCNGCGTYADSSTKGSDQLFLLYRNPTQEFELDWGSYQLSPATCGTTSLITANSFFQKRFHAKDQVSLKKGDLVVCMDEGMAGRPASYAWVVKQDTVTGGTTEIGSSILVEPNQGTEYLTRCNATPNKTLPVFMTCGALKGGAVGFYLKDETLWLDDDGDSLVGQTLPLTQTAEDDIPIGRNIEDMQIAYCIPAYGNASMSEADQATVLDQCMKSAAFPPWHSPADVTNEWIPFIRAIKIALVARGPRDTSGKAFVSHRPKLMDHQGEELGDTVRFPRMIQSIVVQVPNIRYLYGYAPKELMQ